jgi:cellulose synthase/poly-beta-1,6-N-acetylglucosamine synthase-like glycosyltransferase
MLTEDIDASLRVILAGLKIMTDPKIISKELAPINIRDLWNQRMRWAQGWFQVTLRYQLNAIFTKKLSLRQKLGIIHMLGFRELYPWVAMQMTPLLVFWVVVNNGIQNVNWFVPVFIFTTIFTFSATLSQVGATYLLTKPRGKKKITWFLFYILFNFFAYTGFKNIISIVAQIKEGMKERHWKVTPRLTSYPQIRYS